MVSQLIKKLHREQLLSPDEVHILLSEYSTSDLEYINSLARQVTQLHFGKRIFVRGLIEIGNCCRNDCYYCGIRKSNRKTKRYRLDKESILSCCHEGYKLGFRTFVLQGGEDNLLTTEYITDVVSTIHKEFPNAAITLSLGEKSTEAYQDFFNAGANRYLLRHETSDEMHYGQLHPQSMSLPNRLRCLNDLKRIGYQVGTGIMVGSPYQTIEHLVKDILYIQKFHPQMIGIGPFLPHHDTPFATYPSGSISLTLLLLSIFRLMHPNALIPSTTALATLAPDGREQGILAGANVVMPNLSPAAQRSKYMLYDNKAFSGAEAAEGLYLLQERLDKIGYTIDINNRGDFSL